MSTIHIYSDHPDTSGQKNLANCLRFRVDDTDLGTPNPTEASMRTYARLFIDSVTTSPKQIGVSFEHDATGAVVIAVVRHNRPTYLRQERSDFKTAAEAAGHTVTMDTIPAAKNRSGFIPMEEKFTPVDI